MNSAIKLSEIGKMYRISHESGQEKSFRDLITDMALSPFRRFKQLSGAAVRDTEEFWALRDISFDVEPGEVVGIIGRNGAGKSTLLKILSRITEPTEGEARIRGRVGSLLEVGTGFHPELSGRENIFLNGSILGMRRADIARRFDEIVAFAEIERFLDTPVKRYSSGMYVRLAFAVAAHLEPEVLIIDEVLAVGDAVFQKRCLGKMHEVGTEHGRTVLFVSHNMIAVQRLCSRVVWLDGGRVVRDGPAGSVVAEYMGGIESMATERVWEDASDAPGCEAVRVHKARVLPADETQSNITTATPIRVEFEYWNRKPGARLNLSVEVNNKEGIMSFTTVPVGDLGRQFETGLYRSSFEIPGGLLNNGPHTVTLLVVENETVPLSRHEEILVFSVEESDNQQGAWHGEWPGAVRPNLTWQTEQLS